MSSIDDSNDSDAVKMPFARNEVIDDVTQASAAIKRIGEGIDREYHRILIFWLAMWCATVAILVWGPEWPCAK